MRHLSVFRFALAGLVAGGVVVASVPASARQEAPSVAVASGRVSIAGTSNIHDYTATSSAVRVVNARLPIALDAPGFLSEITKPGQVVAFEIAVPVTTLASGKDGLDKNMHKALKAETHREITFRVLRLLEAPGASGALRAVGVLRIAGVEREVTFDVTANLSGSTLAIAGQVPLLMTDFGITPPKAMLGMLKTDPKVTVTFDARLTVPVTGSRSTN